MQEIVTQGLGVLDHPVLHMSTALHIQAFCLWCRWTELACAVSVLSLPTPPAALTLSRWRPEETVP